MNYYIYEVSTGRIVSHGFAEVFTVPTGCAAGYGTITNENYVVGGVPTYVPPPPPTPEQIAEQEEGKFMVAYTKGAVLILYEVDKRLRVLEGQPAITLAQFKNGLKNFLGL